MGLERQLSGAVKKTGTGFGKWASDDHNCLTRIKGMPKRTLGNEED